MHLLYSIAGIPHKWFAVSFILGVWQSWRYPGRLHHSLPSQAGLGCHTNGSPVLPMSLVHLVSASHSFQPVCWVPCRSRWSHTAVCFQRDGRTMWVCVREPEARKDEGCVTPSSQTPCGDSDSKKAACGCRPLSQGRLLAKVLFRAMGTGEGSLEGKPQ